MTRDGIVGAEATTMMTECSQITLRSPVPTARLYVALLSYSILAQSWSRGLGRLVGESVGQASATGYGMAAEQHEEEWTRLPGIPKEQDVDVHHTWHDAE
jgi:hypothetical protein